MGKIRVGVLRGGPSLEYSVSLLTGQKVLDFLPKEKYKAYDILITKDGVWHENGFPAPSHKILTKLDAVFNALHGEYGEDGKVQQILEAYSVPYTGSGIIPSAMAMNKAVSKDMFSKAGLRVPKWVALKKGEDLQKIAQEVRGALFSPWVVKPADRGSSIGVSIAKNIPELIGALSEAFTHSDNAIAEEYIEGREATCGVLENFRGERHYALPVVEIIPVSSFFDKKAKYDGTTREICPANFDLEVSRKIQGMAVAAHKALGLRHYSRSDFIVSKKGIYILETNSLPGLTSESLLPKSSEAIGLSFPSLLDHLVSLALKKI
jgi:D-alanine-D-alanine ligase